MYTFLYVLVSGADDRFADMTALSASFLKDVHPDGRVFVLCNPETERHLRATGHILLSLCDRILTRETPFQDAQSQNRHLKSMMREAMEGDFLYLDSDTLVIHPVDKVFESLEPVSMAHNHNREYPGNFTGADVEYYDQFEWPHPGNGYYLDGGVMFWRDCPESYAFSRVYRKTVELIHGKGCKIMDQPAVNRALELWGGDFGILPDRYNAQVSAYPVTALDACVWHFHASSSQVDKKTHLEVGMELVAGGSLPDPGFIRRVRSSRIHLTTKDREQEDRLIAILKEKGSVRRRELLAITGDIPKQSFPNTFCTIVTSNYMPYALNLLRSIREYDREVHFNIFVSDCERKDLPPTTATDPFTFLHFASDVTYEGVGYGIMHKYRKGQHDAYRWSSKPVFINHLIHDRGYEKVIYVDCDIFFFDGFDFLFQALDTHRVLLTPHWRTPHPHSDPEEYRLLFSHGLYNAGFIAANASATDIMDWWAENCLYSCEKGSFPGEYVDQSILNMMTVYFQGVHVLMHRGCNLSIWNQHACRRTVNMEGKVMINDEFPVVFIHFSSGIPREADPLLGEHFDRYMESLRNFSEEAWSREMRNRSPFYQNDFTGSTGEDRADRGLVHNLAVKGPNKKKNEALYWRVKHRVIGTYLGLRTWRHKDNIAVLTHPKAYHHCLGLWLRETPGTLLASRPIADRHWDSPDEGYGERKTWDIHQSRSFPHGKLNLRSMTRASLVDPVHVSWSNWGSLLGVKRMVMNLPLGWLETPGLAKELATHCKVIALLVHPCSYAYNKLYENAEQRSDPRLKEAESHLKSDEALREIAGGEPSEWVKWVVRWCMDVADLMEWQKKGSNIFFALHEWLEWDSPRALDRLCRSLSLPSPKDLECRFNEFCIPRKGMRPVQDRLKSQYGWNDILNEKDHGMVDDILRHFGIYFYSSREILPTTHILPAPPRMS